MNPQEKKVLKRASIINLIWLLIAIVALGSATYAWFNFNNETNIEPNQGSTISQGEENLLIASTQRGEYSNQCDLSLQSNGGDLRPVSTSNLNRFYSSVGQDEEGISILYNETTDMVNSWTIHGNLYLSVQGGDKDMDVYLFKERLNFGKNIQAIAAMRLGIKIGGGSPIILKLDDMASTTGTTQQRTTPKENVVVASVTRGGANYTNDPSQSIRTYSALAQSKDDRFPKAGPKRLCRIANGNTVAKHLPADKEGVRIAELDEQSYRRLLWSHRPLKDFWRVGSGTVRRLEKIGLTCMGDIARYSTFQYGEDKLYKEFGVNAELLIDHAWGWEPCSLEAVKAYVPKENSLSSGQVLHCPYEFAQARIVLQEMVDALSLELVRKQLVTDQLVLTIGYDIENLAHGRGYDGEIVIDHYGRRVPKHAHGSQNIGRHTSSTHLLVSNALELFDGIVDSRLWIRRITIAVNHVLPERFGKAVLPSEEQLTLFADYEAVERERKKALLERSKERSRQEAILSLQKKYGKNAILKGISLMQGATARQRNEQIGGHKA